MIIARFIRTLFAMCMLAHVLSAPAMSQLIDWPYKKKALGGALIGYLAYKYMQPKSFKEKLMVKIDESSKSFFNTNNTLGLYEAARTGCISHVKRWVSQGGDINYRGGDGQTVGINAVLSGNHVLLEWILEKTKNYSMKDRQGKTMLMYAAENNDSKIFKLLMKHLTTASFFGREFLAKDKSGKTIFNYVNKNHSCYKFLYEQVLEKAKPSGRELGFYDFKHIYDSLDSGMQDSLLSFSSKNLRVDYSHDAADFLQEQAYNKLLLAIRANDYERAALLIHAAKDHKNSQRAFIEAIQCGNLKMVELFLNTGFDVNLSTHESKIPLVCAMNCNHTEIVKKLLEHPNINVNENTVYELKNYKKTKCVVSPLYNRASGADANTLSMLFAHKNFNLCFYKNELGPSCKELVKALLNTGEFVSDDYYFDTLGGIKERTRIHRKKREKIIDDVSGAVFSESGISQLIKDYALPESKEALRRIKIEKTLNRSVLNDKNALSIIMQYADLEESKIDASVSCLNIDTKECKERSEQSSAPLSSNTLSLDNQNLQLDTTQGSL